MKRLVSPLHHDRLQIEALKAQADAKLAAEQKASYAEIIATAEAAAEEWLNDDTMLPLPRFESMASTGWYWCWSCTGWWDGRVYRRAAMEALADELSIEIDRLTGDNDKLAETVKQQTEGNPSR